MLNSVGISIDLTLIPDATASLGVDVAGIDFAELDLLDDTAHARLERDEVPLTAVT